VKGLSARTLRALYNARKVMDAGFRNDPVPTTPPSAPC
jgi:[protein-PII] uridylyltransferase